MKRWFFAVAVAAVASIAVAATASAGVARYQTQAATLTSTVTWNGAVFVHTYDINIACGTFTGTGSVLGIPETITGTTDGSAVAFHAAYANGSGYTWWNSPTGADSDGRSFSVVNTLTNLHNTSTYDNHGQYVSSQGGGDDAAHSCIGMPINSGK
jgi:hypothetical protein